MIMETIYDVPILLRREIEALMIKSLMDAFAAEIGEERAREVIRQVIVASAKKAGQEYAEKLGNNDIPAMEKQMEGWTANDALKMKIISKDEKHMRYDVTSCAYVKMYERLNMKELGPILSCSRDEPFYVGFNPKMKMTRTKELMTGGDCCDFGFTLED